MEGCLREKQQLEDIVREKDAEIEELKKEKQDLISKVKELEATIVSLRKSTIPTHSSSQKKDKPPTSLLANLSARLSLPEKKQQPVSIFANLPARPAFTGFDTPEAEVIPQPSLFAPTVSPPVLPPRPTSTWASRKPATASNMPLTLPTRPGGHLKGTISPLPPHHQSFDASRGSSPPSTAPILFQNPGMPNASLGDTSGSATLGPSATKGNSYHHGPTFRCIPLPPVLSSTAVSSAIPASFDFNQQEGRQS